MARWWPTGPSVHHPKFSGIAVRGASARVVITSTSKHNTKSSVETKIVRKLVSINAIDRKGAPRQKLKAQNYSSHDRTLNIAQHQRQRTIITPTMTAAAAYGRLPSEVIDITPKDKEEREAHHRHQ
jgi:hypothetical protein